MKNDIQALKRSVDALVALLEDWADWQRGYRMKVGAATCSAGFSGSGTSSFDDLFDGVQADMMRRTDAAIDDLPPIQNAAILRRYGVAAVFRFPRENYAECLDAAHERLMVELPRRGVIVL